MIITLTVPFSVIQVGSIHISIVLCWATMRVVAVSYALQPPSNLPPETTDLTPVKSHEFPVSVKNPSDYRAYYEGLRASVMQAKSILGDELTAWRDAVGTAEALKEPKATKEEGGEDEDENADEE